jgi:hypothetical protein
MKRAVLLSVLVSLIAAPSFAAYIVVLRDGTQYKAKERWTIRNGKALVQLEQGGSLQLDPNLIDEAKTTEVNRLGLGNVKVLAQERAVAAPTPQTSTLGSMTKLRRPQAGAPPTAPRATPTPALPAGQSAPGGLSSEVIMKFEAAYENVGIFEHEVTSPAPNKLHVKLVADNEDRVFGAITATAYFIVGAPRSTGEKIDLVELYMGTTNGGAAGRFHMTRADADLLNGKKITPQNYFVQNVLY